MKRFLLVLLIVCEFIYSKDMYSQSSFKSAMAWGDQTSWKVDATNGNWNDNNWYNITQNWDLHNPNYEGGRNLIFDNNNQTTMNNNFSGTEGVKRWQITFTANATASRIINGSTENTFFYNSATKPKIENLSGVNHTISFPIKIGANPLELNPVNGDITISSSINNDGNYIDVYGPNNKVLTLSGAITGTGGFSLKQNSKLVLSTTAKEYTGETVLEAGTMDLSVNLSSNVTVNNSATLLITSSVILPSLTINSGGTVIINSGSSLTISGTLINSADITGLVVKSGGSLIQNSAVSATVEQDISAWVDAAHGWHFLSSPVTSQAVSSAFTDATPENYDFYAWWEPTNQWVNYKNNADAPVWSTSNVLGATSGAGNFIPGKGYLVAYIAGSTKQFTGLLNNANIEVSNLGITPATGVNKGFHLLGNPFTSALIWGTGSWSLNHINATAKIWKESAAAYVDISSGTGFIPALNGFLVEVTPTFGGDNSLVIPTAARVHNATSWYKSSDNPYILLVVSDPIGQTSQESKIRLISEATASFDPEFDSHFLAGHAPMFYSSVGDERLSTNTLPDLPAESVIPFGFIKNNATNFSIELKQSIDGLPVYLTDLKTNTDHNLSENPVYTFTSEAGDDPNRFLLHFLNTTGTVKPTAAQIKVYSAPGKINISGVDGKAEILVRNMMGQVVMRNSVNGSTLQSLSTRNLPAGVYVVSVVSGKQTVSEKVVVK